MITAIVQFNLPGTQSRQQIATFFTDISALFYEVPGLVRKYFMIAEDGKSAGGVYLWESRQQAEQFYTENFRTSIYENFGSEPAITYFESPVIVDNSTGEILIA